MRREDFEADITAGAVQPKTLTVHLPDRGIDVTLRKPTKFHIQRAFVAAGDDEDNSVVGMVSLLKFALIDEDGKQIPRHFDEARAWFIGLSDDDAGLVLEALADLVGDGETGDPKAS